MLTAISLKVCFMKLKKAKFALFVLSCLVFNCLIGAFDEAQAVSQADYEKCKKAKCVKSSPNYDKCKKECGYNGK